jgi:DNA polymerase-3 subunit epsilon
VAPLSAARWVVVDVESSGLDARRDQLISIGAVAVNGGRIALTDSLEVVLRQEQVSEARNILVHGIGGTAQREGLPPQEALLRFLAYAGKTWIVAYHAAFDEVMIGRALREHLGCAWKPPVLDLAYVMPALFPTLAPTCRSLDGWLAHFGIPVYTRHQALADAYATAQLLQVALRAADVQGIASCEELFRLQAAQRGLERMQSGR